MRLILPRALMLVVLACVPAASVIKEPLCSDVCQPDPTSSTFQPTLRSRHLTHNARGSASVLASQSAGVTVGSQAYSYAIPIVNLPGRNGLDLNLTLFYNSGIWNIDQASGTASLNADRDFPSYGFRLGFGYVEGPFTNQLGTNSYTLIEPDGTKRELRQVGTTSTYVSIDSSYIDFDSSTKILRRKNGHKWFYVQDGALTGVFKPTRIQDTNGNYTSITYKDETGFNSQAISTVTDTLGRIITFNYGENNNLLTSLTQGSAILATFTWNTSYVLKYSFTLQVTDTPPNNSTRNVLTGMYYPTKDGAAGGMGFTFEYGDWAIVSAIKKVSDGEAVRYSETYNYPAAATALSDHPTFTTKTVFDGVNTADWTYSRTMTGGQVSSMAVTDPFQMTTTTNLFTSGWQTGLTSSVTVGIRRTFTQTWTQDNTSVSYAVNPRVTATTLTLNDSGDSFKTSFTYDANGNVTSIYEPGRTTQTDYATTFTNQHILDRPSQIRAYTGSATAANMVSRTDFEYDSYGTGMSSAVATQHDDTAYSAANTARGNATSIKRYANPSAGTGPITTTFTYDTLGNVLTTSVANSLQQRLTFTSATQYAFPETIQQGPDGGPKLLSGRTYDFDTSLVETATGPNSDVVSYSYDSLRRLTQINRQADGAVFSTSYDDSSASASMTQTSPFDAASSIMAVTTYDGAGHAIQQETKDASENTVSTIEWQYDALGRLKKVSNPHLASESPLYTETFYDGLNRPTKVILPRKETEPENAVQYSYSGTQTVITDPTGKQRRIYADALGRTARVDEPGWGDASNATGSVSITGVERRTCLEPAPPPTRCYEYMYDSGVLSVTIGAFSAGAAWGEGDTTSTVAVALANELNTAPGSPVTASASGATVSLTSRAPGFNSNVNVLVTSTNNEPGQFGLPSFSASATGMSGGLDNAPEGTPSINHPLPTVYSYDGLNNLKQVVQGVQTRTFTYDGLGHLTSVAAPEAVNVPTQYVYDSFGRLQTRTDPRGVVSTSSYDALNRLVGVAYTIPATTPSIAGMPSDCTTSVGTLANVCYDYGTSASDHNNGRLISMTDTSGSEAYVYDSLGRVTTLTKTISGVEYPIIYAYNKGSAPTAITYPSGRVVQSSYDPVGRPNQIQTPGFAPLLTVNSYSSASLPKDITYGNGVRAYLDYNARLQLSDLKYSQNSSDLLNLTYNYGAGNNGQIQSITDTRGDAFSTSYIYDSWNRLSVGQTIDLTAPNTWKLGWTYDRYGNRSAQALQGGTLAVAQPSLTIDPATNRIQGFSYDAAGNLYNDGLHTYTYDGESRITTVDSASPAPYVYDGSGLRIQKTENGNTKLYIFSGSKVIAEYAPGAAVSAPSTEYVYTGNQLLATITGDAISYAFADQLSARLEYDDGGAVQRTFGHLPFGETWYETGNPSKWKFTSYEHDGSGLDYAMFRYYSPRLGRFMTPDPAGIAAVKIFDPQSWNGYSYTLNQPCSMVDPFGLEPCNYSIAVVGLELIPGLYAFDEIWGEFTRILATGGVGATLVDRSSNPDYTLELTNDAPPGPDTLGRGGDGGLIDGMAYEMGIHVPRARVFLNSISANHGDYSDLSLGVAIGRVMAHELSHPALGFFENNVEPQQIQWGIAAPSFDNLTGVAPARFNKQQAALLQADCRKKRGATGGGGGGGTPYKGGGGGGGRSFCSQFTVHYWDKEGIFRTVWYVIC